MMTALTAKVLAMAFLGQNVVPVVFLIPGMNAAAIWCAWKILGAFELSEERQAE